MDEISQTLFLDLAVNADRHTVQLAQVKADLNESFLIGAWLEQFLFLSDVVLQLLSYDDVFGRGQVKTSEIPDIISKENQY